MTNYLEVRDYKVALDNEGYLKNLEDWNEEIAAELAAQEDIVLGPSHW